MHTIYFALVSLEWLYRYLSSTLYDAALYQYSYAMVVMAEAQEEANKK